MKEEQPGGATRPTAPSLPPSLSPRRHQPHRRSHSNFGIHLCPFNRYTFTTPNSLLPLPVSMQIKFVRHIPYESEGKFLNRMR
ncbi:Protein of unknown function [Gryllus bimaculatus]|nr:Protein of unknown function [Gryllus bimaculatus]